MKIYLAACYSRKVEMSCLATTLITMGHSIFSRWHDLGDEPNSAKIATMCLTDIVGADCVVRFSDVPYGTVPTGGKDFEFGFALGRHVSCVLVGPQVNTFDYLPGIERFEDVDEFLKRFSKRGSKR